MAARVVCLFFSKWYLIKLLSTKLFPYDLYQKPGDTLAPAATLSAKTLTSHLKLDERFDESLQNSDVTDDLDNEVNMTFGQTKEAKEVENQKVASISSPTDNGEAEMEKPEKLKGEQGHVRVVAANEGRRYICNVFCH